MSAAFLVFFVVLESFARSEAVTVFIHYLIREERFLRLLDDVCIVCQKELAVDKSRACVSGNGETKIRMGLHDGAEMQCVRTAPCRQPEWTRLPYAGVRIVLTQAVPGKHRLVGTCRASDGFDRHVRIGRFGRRKALNR